jgi:hypothetical protein
MLFLDPTKKNRKVLALRPRTVFCVIEHAYQDRSVADDVCSGLFTIAGSTLDLGLEVDWCTNPLKEDAEWQIEWHKFYFGLDMATSFSQTGDAKYVEVWQKLVASFISQVPTDFGSSDVLARRILSWIYAWQKFADAGWVNRLNDAFETKLLESIREQAIYLREHLTPERNHRTLELYALFIFALAFPAHDPESELLQFTVDKLTDNLLTDIREDGVQRENSTHYHCTVLRSFLGAKENARRFGIEFPAEFDERLEKACEFAMHLHRPDGQIPAFSDSDTGSYLELLILASAIFRRQDLLYAGTFGKKGMAPSLSNASFIESGYFIQRSGWGTGEKEFTRENFLMFDCGPIGDGGHGHYDLLNVEIAAGGTPLVVDSGRFTYAEDPAFNWRRFFKGTAAHNTVLVDRKDQTKYRRGKPKGDVAEGAFIERVTTADIDVLCGKVVSPDYEAIHTRRIFFVSGQFWLIVDDLAGAVPHTYDLRFHLTPASWNHCNKIETPANAIVCAPDGALLFERGSDVTIEPSWFSPTYGIKKRAPCVSLKSRAKSFTFNTLIAPRFLNGALPQFTVARMGSTTNVVITHSNENTEILTWTLENEKLVDLRLIQQ